MKHLLFYSFILAVSHSLIAQKTPYSVRMAESVMSWHKDSITVKEGKPAGWDYEQGLIYKAIEKVWNRTGDGKYFEYVVRDINRYVQKDGSIRTYKYDDFNLDNIPTGRALLTIYQQTQPDKEKYRKAADLLWKQIENQPQTKEGGYWHKKRYPNQMWLDGLFMAEPFSAEYSLIFNHPAHFNDIAKQFALIEKYAVDPKTGLVYHAYDESKSEKWADPKTGLSPHFWSRAIGWYAMALVDVLDYFPQTHPERANLVKYLQRLAPALVKYQDAKSGVWYQMTTQGTRKGNYFEASASCMFVYALAKGVRMGYLPQTYLPAAQKGYAGILKEFVEEGANGTINLNKTVSVGGLGGTPYRDGSYEYYLSEPIRKNDLKGVGPFIFASVEMEIAAENSLGKGKTVATDYYFNREFRKDWNGQEEQFHYTWEDPMHSGFKVWGNIFRDLGAKTTAIQSAPTAKNLKNVDVYIIVDPDTKKETAHPNFIQDTDIQQISNWVKAGGTLVLMANDTANCEHKNFNRLANEFGIQFLPKNVNMVQGTQWEQGRIDIPAGNLIFKNTKAVYIKELAPLNLKAPAQGILSHKGDVIIGVAKVGKGTVFAVGDPWLYNEYTDGRRIPVVYENFSAAKDLATWLLSAKK
ncbi:glycoside hydrolase family 88 protein [Runella aurantiaca]|uniref:Glycoside hydrolase family 88 protein n=1 Tax=Runella aurantiaca TaxID=2282308 RepID=A0A369I3S9_9BACT|nr:glycoside hydrolase family 88 protein [Runella aurantiaca]RDB02905.1 glycoside hydrolase family 88 protein [Runella aurantiaca]